VHRLDGERAAVDVGEEAQLGLGTAEAVDEVRDLADRECRDNESARVTLEK